MNDAPGASVTLPYWRVERILYDGDGILVVDKPPHIPVHGGDETLCHSATDRLTRHFADSGREVKLSVHQRLDQETSGVLFFVTDPLRNVEYSRAMEAHSIARRYLTVLGPPRGKVECDSPLPESGRVDVWLRHERGKTTVQLQKKSDAEKRAVTNYRVLERVGERTLVEVEIETGRTHQIRATFAHLGHPVVGDRLYEGALAHRLFLHARSLGGAPLPREFHAPVPQGFEDALSAHADFPDRPRDFILDAATLRAPLTERTSAFRLVNDAGDGLPGITVDAYGRYAVLNVYDADLEARARQLAQVVMELGFRGVYEKRRVKADLRTQDAARLAKADVLVGQSAPESFVVDENGMQVNIELGDGLSTGLFVDMRDCRFRARGWARGGKMLNLFCYTCSFSVSAALSGATTTNVDLSAKALERGRANFEKNGLDPAAHRFFKEDAMKFLARAERRGEKFDFIVLDPPSFATVGKGTFSVKGEYGRAVQACLGLLGEGGRLLCVTNHRKTSTAALLSIVRQAAEARKMPLSTVRAVSPGLDVPDGPDGPFPSKCVFVERARSSNS